MQANVTRGLREIRDELVRVVQTSTPDVVTPIPDFVQKALSQTSSPARGILLGMFEQDDVGRGARAAALVAAPPQWLAEGDGFAWLALAHFVRLFGLFGAASIADEQAADRGAGSRTVLLAMAALDALRGGDRARAEQLVDVGLRIDSSSTEVLAVSAFLREDPATALSATDSWYVGEDGLGLRVCLRAWALMATEPAPRHEEAVRLFEAATEMHPGNPGLLMGLAEAETQAAQGLPLQSRTLLENARRHATEARDIFRGWRVPSSDATFMAARAAMIGHDRDTTLRLVLSAPLGEASEDEAQDERCRGIAAVNLALVGKVVAATRLRDTLPQGRTRWEASVAIAQSAVPGAADTTRVLELYTLLLATADFDGERLSALVGLADTGEVPPAEMDWVLERYPELHSEMQARIALASGDADSAIQVLRETSSTRVAVLLAHSYARLGDLDRAAEILVESARRFDAPHLLAAKAYLLADAVHIETDRWGRLLTDSARSVELAQAAVDEALTAAPRGSDAPALQRLRVQLAHQAGDWRGCVIAARAALDSADNATTDPVWLHTRWRLVMSLFNLRDEAAAWRALRQPVPLSPSSPDQARVALTLAATSADVRTLAIEAVDLARRFVADKRFRNWVSTFLLLVVDARLRDEGLSDDEGLTEVASKDVDLVAAEDGIREVVHSAAADDSDDKPWESISLPDDPDEMVKAITEIVQRAQRSQRATVDALEQGLPLGAIVPKNYAFSILTCAGGAFRIEAPDAMFRERELEAARRYVLESRADIAVDLSAVLSLALVPEWAALLRAQAGRVLIADTAVAAAHDARLQFLAAPSASMSVNAYNKPVIVEADESTARDARNRARALAAATKTLDAVPDADPLDDDPEHQRLLDVWSTAVSLARSRAIPLLSDDVGQRRFALAFGIPAFSSAALARSLQENGHPDLVPSLVSAWRALAPTDVPTNINELLELAASADYLPGPASWPWLRPITWRCLEQPASDATSVLSKVRRSNSHRLAQWMHDITAGLLSAGGDVSSVTTILFAVADSSAIVNPRTDGALLAGAHAACSDKGLGDELLRAVIERMRHRGAGADRPGLLYHFADLPPEVASRMLALEDWTSAR
jgi:hypothetical protein